MARAALVSGGVVENVIAIDPESDYIPPEGRTLVNLPEESAVGPGWSHNGSDFAPPPVQDLASDRTSIPADGSTAAQVTYTNTYADAPAKVTFTVNGATKVVSVTAAGHALLDVVSSTPGDVIDVTVDDFPGQILTITVES